MFMVGKRSACPTISSAEREQRQHFDLDKLTGLFRNFVSYENTKYPSFTTSRPLCAWLLRAFPNGTGNQSAA